MATKNDVDASLTKLETAITTWATDTGVLINEMTKAFSRLLQKIAEGAPDLQPEVDRISALIKTASDSDSAEISAIAQAKVEGN